MFPLGVRGRTWFGFPKMCFLVGFTILFENNWFHAPPMTKKDSWSSANVRFFKKCFKVTLIFFCASPMSLSSSSFFILSLSCLFFFFSSCFCCIRRHFFMYFYCFDDMDYIVACCSSSYMCVLFLFFIILSLLFFSLLILRCFVCMGMQTTTSNQQRNTNIEDN